MKKILASIPLVVLIAAGCNFAQPAQNSSDTNYPASNTQTSQQSSNTPSTTSNNSSNNQNSSAATGPVSSQSITTNSQTGLATFTDTRSLARFSFPKNWVQGMNYANEGGFMAGVEQKYNASWAEGVNITPVDSTGKSYEGAINATVFYFDNNAPSLQDVYTESVGLNVPAGTSMKINGYTGLYAVNNQGSYTDVYYLASDQHVVVVFTFREKSQSASGNTDATKVLPAFTAMAKSVKLLK